MSYIILFFKEKTNENLIIDFIKGLLGVNIEIEKKDCYIIKYDNSSQLNFEEIASMLIDDFYTNITLIETNSCNYEYVQYLISLYSSLDINSYYLNDKSILKMSSKSNNELVKKEILKSLYNDHEYLNIIKVYLENDLNTTIASTKLFIHRNTLINKIDKFISITNYDIRKFSDAYIIYQLLN